MVDARREAVGGEERPFSRDFSKSLEERWSQKRGGAKGGALSYIRRTATSLARLVCAALPVVHALSSCGSALLLWFSSSCGSAPPVVQLVLWFMRSWSCGVTCSLETRTGGAALPAVWRGLACPCEERRRELADHRGTSRVQVTLHGLAGPVRSSRSRVIKVHGPCLPPCL